MAFVARLLALTISTFGLWFTSMAEEAGCQHKAEFGLPLFEDQRHWLLNDDFRPITPEPSVLRGHRFANGVEVPDSAETIWVTEQHQGEGGQPHNMLVTVTETGEVTEIASGADFILHQWCRLTAFNSPICLGIILRCRGITCVYT